MSKIISLREQKIKKFHDYLDKKIQGAKEKFSFINNEFLEEHVQEGNVSLEDVVKVMWVLAKKMDDIEVDLIKLKLIILEAQQNDKEE